MAESAQQTVVEVHPAPLETAVVNLPPGTTVRLVRGSHEAYFADVFQDPEDPLPVVAEFPSPEFGGAIVVRYAGGLAGIRNGRHARDRAVWHEAAKWVRDGGVAYVLHEQRDWYGKPVWWAVSVRAEEAS